MGVYLSKPCTDVHIIEGSHGDMSYTAGDMQGWRKNMEDDHIANTNVPLPGSKDNTAALFAVFDGHGGKEVAVFCQYYFVEKLCKEDAFRQGNYKQALADTFLTMDSLLEDPKYEEELAFYRKIPNPSDTPSNSFKKERFNPDLSATASTSKNELSSSSYQPNGTTISGAKDTDSISSEKKTLTPREAVRLFAKLIAEEKAKKADNNLSGGMTDGDRDVAALHAKESSSTESFKPKPFGEPGVVGVQANNEPASKMTMEGSPTCNLLEHRVTAGCTAVVALRVGRTLYVANAGDSRGVLCRAGKAVALSEDHKPQSDVELERITKVGGFVNQAGRVNGNLNLSRSIGDLKYKQLVNVTPQEQMITADPDITTTVLENEDEFMILACDGIWDILSNQDAVDFVREGISNGLSDKEIVESAFKRCISDDPKMTSGLGGDNMTFMLVRFRLMQSS